MTPGPETAITVQDAYLHNLHGVGNVLPRVSDLAGLPAKRTKKMVEISGADPDQPYARNPFWVHWYNGSDRRSLVLVPERLVLPDALTGIKAKIVVALGNRFSKINTHKALADAGDHMIELRRVERVRIFNLAYYTWVEQRGTSIEDFDRRRDQFFWDRLMDMVPIWDGTIDQFNGA
jgi:hypothetical protein